VKPVDAVVGEVKSGNDRWTWLLLRRRRSLDAVLLLLVVVLVLVLLLVDRFSLLSVRVRLLELRRRSTTKHQRVFKNQLFGPTASAENERITGVWGTLPPAGVQGAKPPEGE